MRTPAILAFFLAMMALASPILASPLCISNTTIQTSTNLMIGNDTFTPIVSETECPFGCDTDNNRCNPSPFDTIIIYGVGLVIFIMLLIFVLIKMVKG